MFYLGIDIGKFSSVATLIDEKGTIVDKSLKFSNSTDGANSLLENLLLLEKLKMISLILF